MVAWWCDGEGCCVVQWWCDAVWCSGGVMRVMLCGVVVVCDVVMSKLRLHESCSALHNGSTSSCMSGFMPLSLLTAIPADSVVICTGT